MQDPSLSSATGDYDSFPEYTAPNIWPDEAVLPGFRSTFEELCTLIIDTAVLVARACDQYAESTINGYRNGCLERIVKESTTTKARLLHYFPPGIPEDGPTPGQGVVKREKDPVSSGMTESHGTSVVEEDDWCATHVDHGCLTGLVPAMYIDEHEHSPILHTSSSSSSTSPAPPPPLPGLDVASLSSSRFKASGLYILSRTNIPTKISIPADRLAFQTGEALEVMTRGRFKAVPHFVKGPACTNTSGSSSSSGKVDHEADRKIARNTLAVFTRESTKSMISSHSGLETLLAPLVPTFTVFAFIS